MLKVKNISFSRSEKILNEISFDVQKGEIIGLVGPSGAGKSSLLKIIGGLLDADEGTIFVDDERVVGPSMRLVPGHPEVQLVNQDFALDLFHTVAENIRLQANYLPAEDCEELVNELLELLELSALSNQQARFLSGGEQQRLALARALAKEPKVILLDEPFAHMDAHLRAAISSYLLKLKEVRNTSFILVSHDGTEVLSLADRILFFYDGEIQRVDTPENFYFHPTNEIEGKFFGALNEVELNHEKILFRPIEFSLENDGSSNEIDVKFSHYSFSGPFYQNFFTFSKFEEIVLFHSAILRDVKRITIKKRY